LHRLVAPVGHDQRFRDEIGDVIDDQRCRQIAGHGNGGFNREIAGKDSEPPKQFALRFLKQLIAPIERRSERLMTRQGSAPATRQDAEAIFKMSGKFM
jgi:hypothetical protein